MSDQKKQYLGDGLYAHDDGFMLTLSTERIGGIDYVCLEPEVLYEFFRFIEKTRGLKITVKAVSAIEGGLKHE